MGKVSAGRLGTYIWNVFWDSAQQHKSLKLYHGKPGETFKGSLGRLDSSNASVTE